MKNYLFLVLQEGGVFLYSYPKISSDENILLSALIHAISALQKELLKSEERQYKLESDVGTLYIRTENDLYFVILTKEKVQEKFIWTALERLSKKFLEDPELSIGILTEEKAKKYDSFVEETLGKPAKWIASHYIGEFSKNMMKQIYEDKEKIPTIMRTGILRRIFKFAGKIEWLMVPDKINSILTAAILYSVTENDENLIELGEKVGAFLTQFYPGIKTLLLSRNVLDDWIDKELIISYLFGAEFQQIYYEISGDTLREILILENNPICKSLIRTKRKLHYLNVLAGIFQHFNKIKLEQYNALDVRSIEEECIVLGDKHCKVVIEWKLQPNVWEKIKEKVGQKLIVKK